MESAVRDDQDRGQRSCGWRPEVDASAVLDLCPQPGGMVRVAGQIAECLLDVTFEPDQHEAPHRGVLHGPCFPSDVRARQVCLEAGLPIADRLAANARAASSLPAKIEKS